MFNMNNKYGSLDFLSEPVSEKILDIIEVLEELDIDFYIYYGYPVIDEKENKDYVKGIIITKGKIILLYEHEQEINIYGSILLEHLASDSSLFRIFSNYNNYVSQIKILDFDREKAEEIRNFEEAFTETEIKKINRAIQKAFNLTSEDKRILNSTDSLGAILKERNTFIGNYDSTQFNMVHSNINQHQRIRGLAGSGKTILMLKKLAFLHYTHPNLNLAFVFYTTSLKQDVTEKFKQFYKDYDRYNAPDMSKVNIFHSWGGKQRRGFYSDICERVDRDFINYNQATILSNGKDPFEYVCSDLITHLNEINYEGYYDFIFIDEAQDFGINFFKLCLKLLKEPDLTKNKINTGFLVYAYDELQSLKETTKIPSKQEIFSDINLCMDINLKKCYRTPVEILTSAHAIGLGIYRQIEDDLDHPLVNLVDEKTMVDVGYENLSGEFIDGKQVILKRNEAKSNITINPPESFEDEREQYTSVSKRILDLIKNQDILPKDIMIIDLDESYLPTNHSNFFTIFSNELLQRDDIKEDIRINLVDKNNPVRVSIDNAIPYTTIYRAKGNEANLVFILNCNSISLSSRNSNARNKIFTAMTRAKWQVWLYGKNMDEYSHELDQVQKNNYMLKFNYPNEEQRKYIKKIGDDEERIDKTISIATDLLKTLPDDVLKELLKKVGQKRGGKY
ncbi:ATP-binding domain-containing protein [Tissierella pigra]|uniref:DEAD/DEAH box helicase n=1 Tax=Tissierella pigra TaxID=2607614 RepID=UPI001C0F4218|nr:ATP-binding domain-containing protein [Tissierella pigra]MBU5428434.1 ATP-binding domain-containing protein [Tissierella pigra]